MAGILNRLRAELEHAEPAKAANLAKVRADVGKDSQLLQVSQRGRIPKPALAGDLARRIRAMAERWKYTADDLAYALTDAAERPEAWVTICEDDEQLHAKERRAGLPHLSRYAQ